MLSINPWINFNGNAHEAFTFYQSVLGGELIKIIQMPEGEDAGKYLRIVLYLGPGNELIGNDVPTFLGKVHERENRSKIAIHTDTKEAADRISQGLSAGGEVEMPLAEGPWGSYFSMFRDKYGIEWTVEFEPKETQD